MEGEENNHDATQEEQEIVAEDDNEIVNEDMFHELLELHPAQVVELLGNAVEGHVIVIQPVNQIHQQHSRAA